MGTLSQPLLCGEGVWDNKHRGAWKRQRPAVRVTWDGMASLQHGLPYWPHCTGARGAVYMILQNTGQQRGLRSQP